jgi:hypothetical protein
MKRQTVTLEVEIEGNIPDPIILRDRVAQIGGLYGARVVHVEIVDKP